MTINPRVVNLSGTRIYDQTTGAASGIFTLGNLVAGESLTLTGAGSVASKDVSAGTQTVTLGTLALGNGSGLASNYILTGGTDTAVITPYALTLSAANIGGTLSKVYDGTTTATGASISGGAVMNALAGDTITLTGLTLNYNSAHVLNANTISATGTAGLSIVSAAGSLVGDYSFVAPAITPVTSGVSISAAPLTVGATSIGGTLTKVYDGTTAATGATLVGGAVSGGIAGDSIALSLSSFALNYNSAHVLNANAISATGTQGFNISSTASGSVASDYSFSPATIAPVSASITPAPLTLTANIIGNTSMVYNGAAAASGASVSGSVSGGVTGDTLTLDTTGVALNYNTAHVVGSSTISATGTANFIIGSSSAASVATDYSFTVPTIASVAGSITPYALGTSLSIGGTLSKVYDGTAAATNATLTGALTGIQGITGDTLNLNTAGITFSYNSAHVATANTISASGAATFAITSTNSSSLLSDYSFTGGNIAPVTSGVSITAAPLTVSGATIGGTLTKVYDGTANATGAALQGVTINGGVSGDSFGLSGLAFNYNSAHVVGATSISASGTAAFSITNTTVGSLPSDYSFTAPTIASVSGSITAAPLTLTASIVGNTGMVYNGATTATGATISGGVTGGITGDTLTLDTTGVALNYNTAHVVGSSTISPTGTVNYIIGSSAAGSVASDYSYTAPAIASVAGSITPYALGSSLSIVGTFTKVYDGTVAAPNATLTGTLTGIAGITGDTVNLNTSGIVLNYNTAHVATANTISATGAASLTIAATSSGSLPTDYSFTGANIAPVTNSIANPVAITPLASVVWTGLSGNWSNTANWAGGAIPLGIDVLAVTIPSGVTVTYDSGVVGATSLNTLTSGGGLVMAAGTLSTSGNLSTASYTQTGGTLNVGGNMNVTQSFTKASGATGSLIMTGGNNSMININQAVGNLAFYNDHTINLGTVSAAGSMLISTTGGDINVDGVTNWAANSLTLSAQNNININANLNASGTASLALKYGQGAVAAGNFSTYNLNGAQVNLPSGLNFSTVKGSNGVGTNYWVINSLGVATDATTAPATATLQGMAATANLAGNYVLGSNIDATATSAWNANAGFSPINFTGKFDGLGHTINNLTINRPATNDVGLFGFTTSATIQNVGLLGGSVTGNSYVGGMVGVNDGGSINNSYTTGNVVGKGFWSVGGLVGANGYYTNALGGTVSNSYSTSSVSGILYNVGGLVGGNYGTVKNSYASGSVGGTGNQVGGLVGHNYGAASVITSYSTGNVSGSFSLGGLVGYNIGTVTNSFWNTTTSGKSTSSGGTGLTTTQMQTASNFTGFNFTTTPGLTGNNWVMVDANGSLNNAGGAAGGALPMLASEYATTINNAHQLQLMAMNLSANYTLGQNISATATSTGKDVWGTAGFVSVGNSATPFTGMFDGLGYTVSGLTIAMPSANYVGLFGDAGTGSAIQNVGLVGDSVSGVSNVGGLVGWNSGAVSNSYVNGSVVSVGGNAAGGLVGENGIGGTILNSYATGSVSGTGASIGGLVGGNYGSVSNSYAVGSVLGTGASIGGLVGGNNGTVSNSFWNTTTSGQTSSAGGVGMATADIQTQANFTSATAANGNVNPAWDFANTWVMYDGYTAPLLRTFMTSLTVTAGNASKIYDGLAYSGGNGVSYSVTPNMTNLLGTVSYSGSSQGAINAGSYTITPSGLYSNQQGYIISYVNGLETVNPRVVNLSGTRVYDQTTGVSSGIFTLGNLVSGETLTLTGTGNVASKDVGSQAVSLGTLALGNGSGLASNYILTGGTDTAVITPYALTLSATSIGGTLSKVYDGTTAATGAFIVGGAATNALPGDAISLTGLVLNYNSAHVLSANTISASGTAGLSIVSAAGSLVGDYSFVAPTIAPVTSGVSISAAPLTVAATSIGGTLTKIYDGTTAATGATLVGGAVSGGIAGDTIALSLSGFALNYNSAHVVGATTIGVTGTGSFIISNSASGSAASDYSLTAPSITSVAGSITPAPLTATASIIGNTSMIYNGATTAIGASVSGIVSGGAAGDTLTLDTTGVALNYNTAHVVGSSTISATGTTNYLIGSSVAASVVTDYSFTVPTIASVAGSITPYALGASLSIGGTLTKIYDGTVAAPSAILTGTLTGIQGLTGDTLNLNTAGIVFNYNTAHVATANTISASGAATFAIASTNLGSLLSDYSFTGGGIAPVTSGVSITAVPLTVSAATIGGTLTKVYDGTSASTGANLQGGAVTGGLVGDSISLIGLVLNYNSAHVAAATSISASGTAALSITNTTVGSLPGDYSFTAPTIASVSGSITAAPLTSTAGIGGNTIMVYNGATMATGASLSGSVAGGIAGDSLNLTTNGYALNYNTSHVVGSSTITATGGTAGFTIANSAAGSQSSDYSFSGPLIGSVTGSITAAPLTSTAAIGGTTSKVYNGASTATGASLSGSVLGGISGDTLTLTMSGYALNYNTLHVVGSSTISATGGTAGFTITGSAAGSQSTDYSFTGPTIANVAGTITAAPLTSTAAIGGNASMVYNGLSVATGASLSGSVAGGISGDTLALTTNGYALNYNTSHVVGSSTISAAGGTAGFTITGSAAGSQSSDYSFTGPTIANVAGTITAAPLTSTAVIGGNTSMVYNGSNVATGASLSGSVAGNIAGDTLALTMNGYALNYNTSHVVGSSTISATGGTAGFTIAGSAAGSQSTDYSFAAPTISSVAGSITPYILGGSLSIGGTLTKGYDGTAAATGASLTGALTGILGDTLSLNASGIVFSYNTAHVTTANTISATGSATFNVVSSGSGSLVSDYSFNAPNIAPVTNGVSITPLAVTIAAESITGTLTKTYNGTTASVATLSGGLVSGGLGTDSLSLSGQSLVYNSAHVLSANTISTTGTAVLNVSGGTLGSLASDYSITQPSATISSGVSITPLAVTITAESITGTLTKIYDGTNASVATLSGGAVSGGLGTDNLSLSGQSLVYNSAHVLAANTISESGTAVLNVSGGTLGSLASDYSFTQPGISSVAGNITAAPLNATASIGGTTSMVYNGGTTATNANVSGSVSGGIAGDSLSLNAAGLALNYNTSHVATANIISASGTANFTIGSSSASSLASDYGFTGPNIASVAGSITPYALGASVYIGGSLTKVYDGTVVANNAILTGTLTGIAGITGDVINLNTAGITLNYNTAHVATANTISASGAATFVIASTNSGSQLSDYSFTGGGIAPVTSGVSITPLAVTVAAESITGTLTKTYDGTTASVATLSGGTVSGGLGTDNLSISGQSLVYNSAHVLSANTISESGTAVLNVSGGTLGSLASDYSISQPTVAAVTSGVSITPLAVAISAESITGTLTKTYDGTTASVATLSGGTVSGGLGTDSLSISGQSLVYNSAHVASANTISESGAAVLNVSGGTLGSLASDYSITQPTVIAVTSGVSIMPLAVNISAESITGTLTKTYNGTTASVATLSGGTVSGGLGTDSLSLSGQTLVYNSAHVASANTISELGTAVLNVSGGSLGSLASDYSITQPTVAPVTSGVSITPLAVNIAAESITGTLTKSYDGTIASVATLSGGTVSGGLGTDSLSISGQSLVYNSAHVASANAISTTGTAVLNVSGGTLGSLASDYSINQPSATISSGVSITPLAVSIAAESITGTLTKTYDGTTVSVATLSGGTVSGGLGTDSLSISGQSLVYNSAHVLSANTISESGTTVLNVSGGTLGSLASDYSISQPTVAPVTSGISIIPMAVNIAVESITGTLTKAYDGTTASVATLSGGAVSGGLGTDSLSISGQSLVYNSAHVASANTISESGTAVLNVSGGTLGSLASDYSIIQPTVTAVTSGVSITPLTVTIAAESITGALTKTYNGTTAAVATLSGGTVSGGLGTDSLSLSGQSLVYNSAHVASANTISESGTAVLNVSGGTLGSLASDYSITQPTVTPVTSGVSITPLAVTIAAESVTGTLTKTYDGTTASVATLSGGTVSGGLVTDSLSISGQSLVYNSAHVASANTISATGTAVLSVSGGTLGSLASDYSFTQPSATISSGVSITPLAVTIATESITGTLTKTYDGTTASVATLSGGTVSGGLGTDSLSISGQSLAYNSAHVASANTISELGTAVLNVSGGTLGSLASDYSITQPTVTAVTSGVSITPLAVNISAESITGTLTKTYNGTTASVATLNGGTVSGGLGTDSLSLSGQSLVYNSAHVASANTISEAGAAVLNVSGGTLGSLASDYSITQPTVAPVTSGVSITPLAVTITAESITGTLIKTYDGTTASVATLSGGTVSGGLGTDSLSLSGQTLVYNSAHVASANTISATGTAILSVSGGTLGSLASDYSFTQPSATISSGVSITPLVVTIAAESITGTLTKTYDGTTASVATLSGGTVSGGLGTDSLSISGQTLVYNSAHVASANTISESGTAVLNVSGGTLGSLASDYSISQPTVAPVTSGVSITPLAVTVGAESITGTLTKTYNGTTAAVATLSGGAVSGGLGTDSLSLSGQSLVYNSVHVLAANTISELGTAVLNVSGGTLGSLASDYSFTQPSVTAVTSGVSITPLALTIAAESITGTLTKTYNGTTAAVATLSGGAVSGGLGTDSLSLSGQSLVYNSAHVASANTISESGTAVLNVSGGTLGSLASDYSFTQPTVAPVTSGASITPLVVTVGAESITGTLTKTYNGTTAAVATLSGGAVSGGLGTDSLSLSGQSLVYNSAHVLSANTISELGTAVLNVSGGTLGSLASDYSITQPTVTSVAGNISAAPLTATASIGGLTSMIYNGATTATGATVSGSVSGNIAGDSLSLNSGGLALNFNTSHVTTANTISATGTANFTIGSSTAGSLASDYSFTQPVISSVVGNITAAPLTAAASIGGTTSMVYNGAATATGASVGGSVVGGITGDSLSLNTSGLALNYNTSHVTTANTINASGTANFTLGSSAAGSLASDYSFTAPTISSVAGSITPYALGGSLSIGGTFTKVYDGTAAATGASLTGSLAGILGDTLNLNSSGIAFSYNSSHVATANTISATGNASFTVASSGSGSLASDYSFTIPNIAPVTTGVSISAVPLTVAAASIGGTLTKVYDGSVAATGAILQGGAVTGGVTGDSISLTGLALNYDSAHVVGATSISASGTAGLNIVSSSAGSLASDYSFTAPTILNVAGAITAAPLTVAAASIGGTLTKVYDGTTLATGAILQGGTVTGGIAGDSIALTGYALNYNSAQVVGATTISASGTPSLSISSSTANSVATDYSFTAPTIASVAGTITAAPLAVAAVSIGGTLTTVYNGTTVATGATLVGGAVSGAVTGDVITLTSPSLNYNSSQVVGANTISATGAVGLSINGSPFGSVASDYSFTQPTIAPVTSGVSVAPRPLTVFANNYIRFNDEANPTNISYSTSNTTSTGGLVNGDAIGPVSVTAPAASTTAQGGDIYPLTPGNATFTSGYASNYNVTYTNGLLLVLPRPVSVTGTSSNLATFLVVDPAQEAQTSVELQRQQAVLASANNTSGTTTTTGGDITFKNSSGQSTVVTVAPVTQTSTSATPGVMVSVNMQTLLQQPLITVDPAVLTVQSNSGVTVP